MSAVEQLAAFTTGSIHDWRRISLDALRERVHEQYKVAPIGFFDEFEERIRMLLDEVAADYVSSYTVYLASKVKEERAVELLAYGQSELGRELSELGTEALQRIIPYRTYCDGKVSDLIAELIEKWTK